MPRILHFSIPAKPNIHEQFTDGNIQIQTNFGPHGLIFACVQPSMKLPNHVSQVVSVVGQGESWSLSFPFEDEFSLFQHPVKRVRRGYHNTLKAMADNALCEIVGAVDCIEWSIPDDCLLKPLEMLREKSLQLRRYFFK